MNRLALGVATLAAALAGCSGHPCGPGTHLGQADNGDAVCLPVTVAHGETECDADGGVELVDGNRCIAQVQCGPGTKLDPQSHECIPVALAGHEPPVCATPTSGHICVNGTLRHLLDGSYLSGETVRVSLYDPTNFIGNPAPAALAEADSSDTFTFSDVPTPGGGYVLLVTHDLGASPGSFRATGIGGTVIDGRSLRLDGYVVSSVQWSAWSLPSSFDSQGALLYRFFDDPAPPQAARTPTETHPVAGVTLRDSGTMSAAAGARYFGATLAATDGTAGVTAASGAVVVTAASFANYTGSGGNVTTWEAHQALPIPHILQLDFLHPQP
jgi:hypothetical protein